MATKTLRVKVPGITGLWAQREARRLADYLKENHPYVIATNITRPQSTRAYALLSITIRSPIKIVEWWRVQQVLNTIEQYDYEED